MGLSIRDDIGHQCGCCDGKYIIFSIDMQGTMNRFKTGKYLEKLRGYSRTRVSYSRRRVDGSPKVDSTCGTSCSPYYVHCAMGSPVWCVPVQMGQGCPNVDIVSWDGSDHYMRILHDEADIDTRDDMTVFNRLISIPYLSAFRRWLRLLISGTCILCPRVRLWLTNRC